MNKPKVTSKPPEETSDEFWAQIHSGMSSNPQYWHKKQNRIDLYNDILSRLDRNLPILDVGCGCGGLWYNQDPASLNLTGIDINDEAEKAWSWTGKPFIKSSATNLPLEDNSFPQVICAEVLEHLTNWEDALKEAVRVCSDKLIISVPNSNVYPARKCEGHVVDFLVQHMILDSYFRNTVTDEVHLWIVFEGQGRVA